MRPADVIAQAQRITALEVQLEQVLELQKSHAEKLDDLLTLRHKGMGAFWLSSALVGTGIVGFFAQLLGWFKHG